jgi:pimeloyl-ACP methyl ester carboxylesterase
MGKVAILDKIITMLYLILIPVIILAALALYIFSGGTKLSSTAESIIDEVLRDDLPELVQGQSGFAISGEVKIWYECIAPPGENKGTVMLFSAMGGDGLFWPLAFVRSFLDAGYAVIRYDHRGTGMSDWIEGWDNKNPYTLVDMAGDAAAVLDALSVGRAHLVGLSLGGMVAQELAIHYPGRAASLTLMMTSAYAPDPDIPGLTTRTVLRYAMRGLPLLRYRILGGERNLIRERIAKMQQMVGPGDWDVGEMATMVLYDLRKRCGVNLRAVLQHQAAVSVTPPRFDALSRLKVPALIIHGTEDDIIPVEHGKKLATAIPGARTIWLEGVGHVFPPPGLPELTVEIIAHIEASASLPLT